MFFVWVFCSCKIPHLSVKHVHVTNMLQLLLITVLFDCGFCLFLFVYFLSLPKCGKKYYSIHCGKPPILHKKHKYIIEHSHFLLNKRYHQTSDFIQNCEHFLLMNLHISQDIQVGNSCSSFVVWQGTAPPDRYFLKDAFQLY